MPRARTLKPGFFTDAELVECPFWVRLLFAGLWTLADRDGRLIDRPKQLSVDLFPRDAVDAEVGLAELAEHGLIVRYEIGDLRLIQIVNFSKHQNPHRDERASILPPLPFKEEHGASTVQTLCEHGGNPAISPYPITLNHDSHGSTGVRPRAGTSGAPAREAAAAAAENDSTKSPTTKTRTPRCAFADAVGDANFFKYAQRFAEVNVHLSRNWLHRTVTRYEAEGLSLPPPAMIDALSVALTRIAEALEQPNGIRHPAAWAAGQIGDALREAAEVQA